PWRCTDGTTTVESHRPCGGGRTRPLAGTAGSAGRTWSRAGANRCRSSGRASRGSRHPPPSLGGEVRNLVVVQVRVGRVAVLLLERGECHAERTLRVVVEFKLGHEVVEHLRPG